MNSTEQEQQVTQGAVYGDKGLEQVSDSLIAEIVAETGVCGGVMPQTSAELWNELVIWKNLAPKDSPAKNVAMVLEALGEPWDDDFLNEDGSPSLAALETVHAQVRSATQAADRPNVFDASSEEDEDDEFVVADQEIAANTALHNILNVIGWVREGRLNLNPDWQRSFVWKPRKQKALIESILLGLPIPSFLLYKDRESGQMSVIDGRQRLETVYRFTHPKEARGEPRLRFRTCSASQEGWRPGQFLNPAAAKFYHDLPNKFKTQFDTQNLQVAILDVPLAHLYQIFKRYNTGSVALNAAEIRNAVFQNSGLHEMMFRLGGEHRDPAKYADDEERRVAEDLRSIMKNKQSRYGAYDFVGRILAFAHETTGSVAKATFSFMSREHRADAERIESFRRKFLDAFTATADWYEHPLTEPRASGAFHAFLATIQMVSTIECLNEIRAGGLTEEAVRNYIRANWRQFAETEVLSQKQNSTNFWAMQRYWTKRLKESATA